MFPVLGILHRLIEPGIHHRMLFSSQSKKLSMTGLDLLHLYSFRCSKDIPMFLAVSFVHKQFITVFDCLHGGNTQVILLSLWDGIHEISPNMGPATSAPDIFQVVMTLISICFQVSAAVSFQESLRYGILPWSPYIRKG